jgi:hypothetical protein
MENASHALSRTANTKPELRGQVNESTGLRPVLQVLERGSRVKMQRMPSLAPNPSIERTAYSGLRPLPAAAHVER